MLSALECGDMRACLEACLDARLALANLERRLRQLERMRSLMPAQYREHARELNEVQQQLMARYVALEKDRAVVDSLIDLLPPMKREVIRARYVDGMNWNQVAEHIGYSVDHCYTLHRDALRYLVKTRQQGQSHLKV